MPQSIAQLMVEVGADTSGAVQGLGGLNEKVNEFGAAGRAALPASTALAAGGVAVGAGFVQAINTAADFEQAMSGIKAVMAPADVQQFGSALHDLALTLGKDTTFTAREAAGGIEELVKAGIPAEAILGGAAKQALALAAATGTPVADAATIAAQALNAFRVPADQLAGTVDFLAGTVNASAADMTDLKFGLQSVGAVAATVGLSFNDTATALGLFANNGLRGSDAGTSLKTMLLNLQPSTKAQKKLFRELGLVTEDGANQFFDAEGKAKDLAGIAGTLQTALAGQTEQQKLANLETLFGTDALRAAAILSREGADGVNRLTGEISKISAVDAANTRLGNFNGAMQQLQGSLETAAITLGERFLPVLTQLTNFATQLVNAFLSLPEPVQNALAGIVAIAGIALVVVGGLGLLAAGVGILAPAFAALGSVVAIATGALVPLAGLLGVLLGPIGLIIAAIGLLAVAWVNNWGDIQGKTAAVVDFFNSNVLPFLRAFVDLHLARLQLAIANLATFWSTQFLPALQATGAFFNQYILPPFAKLDEIIRGAQESLRTLLAPLTGPLGDTIRNLFGNVGANAAPNLQASTAALEAEAARTREQAGITTVTNINSPLTGPVTLTSDVNADRFIDQMASVIESAENRVVPPQPAFGAGAF